MTEEKKCCKFFKWFVLVAIVINTIFLGGIYCSLYKMARFCGGVKSAKICPLTGKALKGSPAGEWKGSGTQQ
jgi:hypothetical protein